MVKIPRDALREVTGICHATAIRWVKGLPHTKSRHGKYLYELADVVASPNAHARWLEGRRALDGNDIARLMDRACITEATFVGNDALPRARKLAGVLKQDEHARLFECQVAFTTALANSSMGVPDIFEHIESLRLKLLLSVPVFKYVFLADPTAVPNWDAFAPAFALTNARFEEMEAVA